MSAVTPQRMFHIIAEIFTIMKIQGFRMSHLCVATRRMSGLISLFGGKTGSSGAAIISFGSWAQSCPLIFTGNRWIKIYYSKFDRDRFLFLKYLINGNPTKGIFFIHHVDYSRAYLTCPVDIERDKYFHLRNKQVLSSITPFLKF
jgi:hypothetical protein